ncbi:DUF3325 family protein [Shewanella youngdeokensis]|uniref:DUF3325 family protein n=1 Tax=Shewanella youngdeokensis TaxID=2999068 RepID=A0ABZ0K1W5_9GAMM|nr:DUF3325 family protein [Shewanella sp. DAU334]
MLEHYLLSTAIAYISIILLALAMSVPRRKNWYYNQNTAHRYRLRLIAVPLLLGSAWPMVLSFGATEGVTLWLINLNLLAFLVVMMVSYFSHTLYKQCIASAILGLTLMLT